MSDIVTTDERVRRHFEFLRGKEARFLPRYNMMIGYAYGYAEAALEAGREDLAAPKADWLMVNARKHGQLIEESPGAGDAWLPNGGHSEACAYVGGIGPKCTCSSTETKESTG